MQGPGGQERSDSLAVGPLNGCNELLDLALLILGAAVLDGLPDAVTDVVTQKLMLHALERGAHGVDLGDACR
jgi:hypothetical protein